MDIRLTQFWMTESGKPSKDEIIHANDILNNFYDKTAVDNLIKDPTANTMVSCVGYDDDILGGY